MFPSIPRPVAPLRGAAPLSARRLLAGLLLLGAACGGSGPTGTAESAAAPAGGTQPTTAASATDAGSGATTPAVSGSDAGPAVTPVAEGGLPGEPFDFEIPRSGDRLAVVGVAHDDVLNVRILPGADQPIVEKLAPMADDVVATGRKRRLPDEGSIWAEVTQGVELGWVNASYLGYLGVVDDWTSQVVEANGGRVPAGASMEALGRTVVEVFVHTDPAANTRVVQVGPATAGDLGEITYDVVGFLDDSQLGVRLHLFGAPSEDGGFHLASVEATVLCSRGATDAGACL